MALQNAIADALSAVFGHGTVEYNRYSSAARLDHGPVTMTPAYGTARHSADRLTASQYLAEGKQQSLALLRQAVRTLEEEIAEQQQFATPTSTASIQRTLERKVFVVHGHIGKYFYVVDFVVDFYGDPSETPLGGVACKTTKGVPDGSRTPEPGR
jgi:hypothetical protein